MAILLSMGTAKKLLIFISVFGTEFQYIGHFKEMPASENAPKMPDAEGNKLMHVFLHVSNGTVLMGSDTGGEWAQGFWQGNNFSISVNAENKEEAEKLFNGLTAGGKITMPLAKTFWSDCFGMLTDKFGINWMVSHFQNHLPVLRLFLCLTQLLLHPKIKRQKIHIVIKYFL